MSTAFTPTELQLLAVYRAPAVSLDAISKEYLNVAPGQARRAASLNQLPFPTFKLSPSQKAPVMVKVSDLAAHIDATHQAAKDEWEKLNAGQ